MFLGSYGRLGEAEHKAIRVVLPDEYGTQQMYQKVPPEDKNRGLGETSFSLEKLVGS